MTTDPQAQGAAPGNYVYSAAQLLLLRAERDIAVKAGEALADQLQQARAKFEANRAAIAALRADRSWQQAAVVRVLFALGICAAVSILWH
jgi:hypothetical protein